MLAYCTRRLHSRSDAEDAVQTTFLYALRALRRGVEPACESAWLYSIAKNVCSWQQRTASRRCQVADDFEIEALACAQTDEDVELLSGIRGALESLPLRQRQALVLREWHGVPPREIAVELGLTAPQTHALLTRARHALARALTAPKRAALGLGALVFEFRAHLKVLAGGASVKAAAMVTIAVAGSAGVAGAAVEESARQEGAGREAPSVVTDSAQGDAGVAGVLRSAPGVQPAGTGPVTTANDTSTGPEGGLVPTASPDAGAPGADAASGSEPSSAPSGAPQAGLPVDLPPVPVVDPPTNPLPAVALPPVELPPVDLPPVTLPPVNVPPVNVNLPPVDLPPVDVAAVEVPPVEVPPLPLPNLPLPPLGLPR
jgi:RNA polymerase sigma factor (sigma-70 family)